MSIPRLLILIVAFLAAFSEAPASAAFRQYYSSWNLYPQRQYYYRTYYYKPSPDFAGYNYHYAIYYPDKPNYVYYYNPYKRVYWGRCDLRGKAGQQYSLLAEQDRKENLSDIPESAFPALGKMPPIPGSKDDVAIEPPKDLPKPEK